MNRFQLARLIDAPESCTEELRSSFLTMALLCSSSAWNRGRRWPTPCASSSPKDTNAALHRPASSVPERRGRLSAADRVHDEHFRPGDVCISAGAPLPFGPFPSAGVPSPSDPP